jgi:hypothetical protein
MIIRSTSPATTPDECAKIGYYAMMSDSTNNMNFCNRFFNDKSPIRPYTAVKEYCKTIDLRLAHRTRAVVLIHELTHTKFAMGEFGS